MPDMNLTEELDRSFDDGPAHRPIEDRLQAGHRLVRRRRLAASAAALATVAVLGTAGIGLATSDDGPSRGADFAEPGENQLHRGELLLDADGTLRTGPGVEVVRQVENPRGYAPPRHSLGVVYRFDGAEYWGLVETDGSATEIARQSFPTFEMWLDDQVKMQDGQETLALVRFGEGETLLPRDGVEILRQTGDLSMMPASFAGPGDRTAVAEVRYDGERWYVLARQLPDSDPEYFASAASVTAPTLDQFLTYAADSYASGTGLR